MIRRGVLLVIAVLTLAGTSGAFAQTAECYDVEVSAHIVTQTPAEMPECGDCIVMRWPWILDLDVREVHAGDLEPGPLTVLSMQHSDIRSDIGLARWKLRRHQQGGFNVVGFMHGGPDRQCSIDDEPVRAYINTETGSLDDLRRRGRERYGRDN